MRRILIALILVTSQLVGRTPPESKPDELSLQLALEKDWSELVVSQMIDQGCVAPIYAGLRITRTAEGLRISTWQEDHHGPVSGTERPMDISLLPGFIQSTVRHYAAALASKDMHEQLAELEDEATKRAWMAAITAAGGTLGGLGACGIDVRITNKGLQSRFRDSYGSSGYEELVQWLKDSRAGLQDR